jgi:hypothetical protein
MFVAASIMLGHNVVAHHHFEHCHQHESDIDDHHQHHRHDHPHQHSHSPSESDSFLHLLAHLHHSPEGFVCVSHQSLLSWKWLDFDALDFVFWGNNVTLFVSNVDIVSQPVFYRDLSFSHPVPPNIGLRAPPVFII